MPKTLTNVNARPKNLDIENVIKIPKNTYFQNPSNSIGSNKGPKIPKIQKQFYLSERKNS